MSQLPDPNSRAEERQGLLENEREEEQQQQQHEGERPVDPRFEQPTPSPFKRILLLLFIGFLFWLAFALGRARLIKANKPQIIYSNRYSAEHKYRPAASPIITETLKDGRLRIRGAGPTATPSPVSTPAKKVKKRKAQKKSGTKHKRAKTSKGAVR
ncbi:hypothetical protein D9757_001816 [Collybiopsis confluens]|uniref:Uncharacterized protein n=1 Tax=Collybiopsis confluens TaxID=2823264 RepID=A0A8H5HYN0_9AGAR|nr:hypothetical protein D9757_001816 [Collybiopsis confluens]